ncbi:XkdQ/YqbQ family protein [Anaerosporobacter sp.]
MYELTIYNNNILYSPSVIGDVTWDTERSGSPGTLKFEVYQDGKLDFEEGNEVRFIDEDDKVFFGYVFTKKRSSTNNTISITAYDQLRYFKNKDTYSYSKKSASELLKMLAKDFYLKTGSIDDTVYKMSRVEDNTTLFDMMLNSINETLKAKKIIYVLYDNFGKLNLKNVENMFIPIMIDSSSGESLDYTTSIDSNTYNKIKLVYEDSETNKREVYIEKSSEAINDWGLLQYYETIQDKTLAKKKAQALLELYNMTTKELKVNSCFGDNRVRAGCCIYVNLTVDNVSFVGSMLVEKVKHTYSHDSHFMDLTLIGVDFNS